MYFSSAWQAIEERNSSNVAQVQYTWSAAYIDAMIARDWDTDNNGTLEQRVYVMQDVNWNITAITNSTGAVVERFQYDAYGKRTVLSPTFVAASDTFVFNAVLYLATDINSQFPVIQHRGMVQGSRTYLQVIYNLDRAVYHQVLLLRLQLASRKAPFYDYDAERL